MFTISFTSFLIAVLISSVFVAVAFVIWDRMDFLNDRDADGNRLRKRRGAVYIRLVSGGFKSYTPVVIKGRGRGKGMVRVECPIYEEEWDVYPNELRQT